MILARDLQPGDSIKVKGGTVYFHRVPVDRSRSFTADYTPWKGGVRNDASAGSVTYEPDEEVDVVSRWPVGGLS